MARHSPLYSTGVFRRRKRAASGGQDHWQPQNFGNYALHEVDGAVCRSFLQTPVRARGFAAETETAKLGTDSCLIG